MNVVAKVVAIGLACGAAACAAQDHQPAGKPGAERVAGLVVEPGTLCVDTTVHVVQAGVDITVDVSEVSGGHRCGVHVNPVDIPAADALPLCGTDQLGAHTGNLGTFGPYNSDQGAAVLPAASWEWDAVLLFISCERDGTTSFVVTDPNATETGFTAVPLVPVEP
jgi:hypothetical protein